MSQPLVSICIPTFNGENFIAEAMNSIVKQTYDSLEIVVSDDDSIDRTLEIITSYKDKINAPIRIFNHIPSGIGDNWNNCITNADGEFIKFLFQDDVLYETCIEDMVDGIISNASIGMVTCKRDFIEEGKENLLDIEKWMNLYKDLQAHLDLPLESHNILDKSIFKSPLFYSKPINFIGEPSAVLFRKSLIKTIGLFRTDLKQNLDIEFWFRILKQSSVLIVNKALIQFRIHPNQATQKNTGKVHEDSRILNRLLYEEYFWLLNKTLKKKLFLRHHPIGKLIDKYR